MASRPRWVTAPLAFELFGHRLLVVFLTALVVIASSGETSAAEVLRCPRFSLDPPSPTPRTDRPALNRLERINQAVKDTPHAVLFFGNSLTEGWDPGVWEQNLAPRRVLNAGISGDRTDHLLWRLEHGNLAGPPPSAVVLMIGTNDLGEGRSPELTAEGVRANLERLRQRLPDARILLLGLLPREQSPMAPLRISVGEVNRLIRSCADEKYIFSADIGDLLLDSNGRLTDAISPDRLHFSARGYALLASRLDPVLDRLLAAAR